MPMDKFEPNIVEMLLGRFSAFHFSFHSEIQYMASRPIILSDWLDDYDL
jgi:hypothetical protein